MALLCPRGNVHQLSSVVPPRVIERGSQILGATAIDPHPIHTLLTVQVKYCKLALFLQWWAADGFLGFTLICHKLC